MQISGLSEKGGASVTGVDLSRQQSASELRALNDLYDRYGLVIFRDQKLTKRQLVDATHIFGGPQLDPPVTAPDPEVHGIVVISTRGAMGTVMPEEERDVVLGDIEWHTDEGYIEVPNRGKMLYAIDVPEKGGMTGFIDCQRAYDDLPQDTKHRLDSLHVVQSWRNAEKDIEKNKKFRVDADLMKMDAFPDLVWRAVHEHPNTGKKILNVVPLWATRFVELPGPDGDTLLQQMKAHLKQERYIYWHKYRTGDVCLWDNWRFLHAASGTPARYKRTLWSVVIQGGPQFGHLYQPEPIQARQAS
jgi:taurine dioxygenase